MKKLLIAFVLISFLACSPKGNRVVQIDTDYGYMKIELFNDTPLHRDNFIKLIKEGYYDDLIFHRVIKNFMIQGGDPDSKNSEPGARLGSGGPGYKIPAEIGRKHFKGALSAARMGDGVNPDKESSGSQFYVVQGTKQGEKTLAQTEKSNNLKYTPEEIDMYKQIGGTPMLDNNYTVFGQVVEGMDVIDKIASLKTDRADRPEKDVKMTIKIIK